ncbi:hypothetical protein DESAMIL20_1165 [Desulfurella amilsii]|uniref:Mobile element protein n=1 Tax=Desulfurella amilsii TaxID=1562698 RepID=A0A1X4XVP7_9BACT|nr:hypothetical protein [Desulfurella amilsii]OSS41612.1 hypothetical protein DESAMIL20_1165 [Desulfurella amilsii]
MDVLLSTAFEHISQNALYRISDKLLLHKDQIESLRSAKVKTAFEEKLKSIIESKRLKRYDKALEQISRLK